MDKIADVVAPRSEDPKLIIRVITFELLLNIYTQDTTTLYGQTDGRTTYDSNTALSLRALGGKNVVERMGTLL